MCARTLEKELPTSLCVDDVRATSNTSWVARALRSPVLVLVAGDVAQAVSAESACQSVRFLYEGSEFDVNRMSQPKAEADLEQGFVKIVFYGSLTVFSKDAGACVWRPRDTAPLESALMILPRVLPESKLGYFARRFQNCIYKCAEDSTWLVERAGSVDSYCEKGLLPFWIVKAERQRAREEAERAHEEARRAREGQPPPVFE